MMCFYGSESRGGGSKVACRIGTAYARAKREGGVELRAKGLSIWSCYRPAERRETDQRGRGLSEGVSISGVEEVEERKERADRRGASQRSGDESERKRTA